MNRNQCLAAALGAMNFSSRCHCPCDQEPQAPCTLANGQQANNASQRHCPCPAPFENGSIWKCQKVCGPSLPAATGGCNPCRRNCGCPQNGGCETGCPQNGCGSIPSNGCGTNNGCGCPSAINDCGCVPTSGCGTSNDCGCLAATNGCGTRNGCGCGCLAATRNGCGCLAGNGCGTRTGGGCPQTNGCGCQRERSRDCSLFISCNCPCCPLSGSLCGEFGNATAKISFGCDKKTTKSCQQSDYYSSCHPHRRGHCF